MWWIVARARKWQPSYLQNVCQKLSTFIARCYSCDRYTCVQHWPTTGALSHQPWSNKMLLTWTWLLMALVTLVKTLRPKLNGRHFPNNIFRSIFWNDNLWISISLKYVPKGPINNIPALIRVLMAWRRPCDKQLSEPIVVSLLTHICITWPQRVNAKSYLRLMRFC